MNIAKQYKVNKKYKLDQLKLIKEKNKLWLAKVNQKTNFHQPNSKNTKLMHQIKIYPESNTSKRVWKEWVKGRE